MDQSKDRLLEIQKMALEELSEESINSGKAKRGMKFPQAFEDNRWTDWFVGTYEDSPKEEHQKYVVYVDQRLDAGSLQSKGHTKGTSKAAPKAKAKNLPTGSASES